MAPFSGAQGAPFADRDPSLQGAIVRSIREVARDVRLIELVPRSGPQNYPPGSHLDIAVRIGDTWDTRSYSLVGAAAVDGAYRIAVKHLRQGRGGSSFIHALNPGMSVQISSPRSHFGLTNGRDEYLLIAGGIGITPLHGMVQTLARRGTAVRLLYAVRTPADLVFADELHTLLGDRLEVFISSEGRRLDVAREIEQLSADAELYVCGPLRLRESAQHAWQSSGRQVKRLRFETFGSSGRFPPQSFVVRVRDHGDREIRVDADMTLLAALEAAGVEMISDCRRGECGLCQVSVLSTECELDHRDVFLSDDERRRGNRLVSCVSRAAGGRIVIDTWMRP